MTKKTLKKWVEISKNGQKMARNDQKHSKKWAKISKNGQKIAKTNSKRQLIASKQHQNGKKIAKNNIEIASKQHQNSNKIPPKQHRNQQKNSSKIASNQHQISIEISPKQQPIAKNSKKQRKQTAKRWSLGLLGLSAQTPTPKRSGHKKSCTAKKQNLKSVKKLQKVLKICYVMSAKVKMSKNGQKTRAK